MRDAALLDNDIVFKTSCYSLMHELVRFFASRKQTVWILGVAVFVLRRRLARSHSIGDRTRASGAFESSLDGVEKVEPASDEVALAADFELYAQTRGLALDSGESLLLAVMLRRSAAYLLTGDKRAIEAIDRVAAGLRHHEAIDGRLGCFEQVIMTLLDVLGFVALRSLICAEPLADRTLSICFSCSSAQSDEASAREGLQSYINDIRERSGSVLMSGNTISAVVA